MFEFDLGPFASVIGDICVKVEVASKPAEEIEEDDTEGVDLYKGSVSVAYGHLDVITSSGPRTKGNRKAFVLERLDMHANVFKGRTCVISAGLGNN